jgi:hypothetical protein
MWCPSSFWWRTIKVDPKHETTKHYLVQMKGLKIWQNFWSRLKQQRESEFWGTWKTRRCRKMTENYIKSSWDSNQRGKKKRSVGGRALNRREWASRKCAVGDESRTWNESVWTPSNSGWRLVKWITAPILVKLISLRHRPDPEKQIYCSSGNNIETTFIP